MAEKERKSMEMKSKMEEDNVKHMQFPNLDGAIIKELNELTKEEVSRKVSYPYEHEILWYGIDAIAHTHLMRMAKDISEGKLSQDEFVKKYRLDFRRSDGFVASLEKIESDGIFIPQQACSDEEGKKFDREVHLFNSDYGNIVRNKSWVNKEYAIELMDRRWQPSDLRNPDLVEQGIKFGRDMWLTCVEGFETSQRGFLDVSRQPQKVTDLGRKLIEYYSALVFSESTSSK